MESSGSKTQDDDFYEEMPLLKQVSEHKVALKVAKSTDCIDQRLMSLLKFRQTDRSTAKCIDDEESKEQLRQSHQLGSRKPLEKLSIIKGRPLVRRSRNMPLNDRRSSNSTVLSNEHDMTAAVQSRSMSFCEDAAMVS